MAEPTVNGLLVRVAPDAGALMRMAAEEVARRAEQAAAERGRFTIALAGGATPKRLYALLADAKEPFRARIPWARTHVFFGDERHVHPGHPESNYGMARAALLSKVPIPPENVHRIRAEDTDAAAAATDYEAELRRVLVLAPGAVPRLDLVLLGLGADGHTASLFPGNDALEERSRLVAAPFVDRLRTHRITLTLPVLEAARAVAFVVSGAEKAERVADVLEGAGTGLPAGRVRVRDGDLLWLLDAAAAAQLRTIDERAG
ncbi:MAG TPA: 6-phosphogluconolactonase [Anaeromyxobacteraceae bacterium]